MCLFIGTLFRTFSSICDFTADFSKRSFSNSDVSLSIICQCNKENKNTHANKWECVNDVIYMSVLRLIIRANQTARIFRLIIWRYPDYWLKCQAIHLLMPPIFNTILCPLKLNANCEQIMVWKWKPSVSLSPLLWVFQFRLHQLPCFPPVFSTDLKHHNFNVLVIKPTKSRSLDGTGTPTFRKEKTKVCAV